jgi:DNA primase
MPQKMVQVLNDFGVPESEWKQALLTNLQLRFSEGGASSAKIVHRTDIEPAIIPLPDYFYFLKHASPNDKWAKIARYYLEDRAVDPESYPFMLAEHTGDPKQDVWFGRVIIPIYKESNLIFYIGRDLTEKKAKKYLSPSYSKEKIIYGFDRLFQNLEEPLYIVEGWFDAHVVNGIAILGNEISEAQEIWLNKSPRQKVYIPDRSGNGKNAALRALDLGWSIATPAKESWASDVKDINDAVKRYGLMYVLRSLAETTATGFAARANLELYCKYEEPNKNRSKKKDYHSS